MALPAGSLDRLVVTRLALVFVVTTLLVALGLAAFLFGPWLFQGAALTASQRDLLADYALAAGIVMLVALLASLPLAFFGSRLLLAPLKALRADAEAAHRRTEDKHLDVADTQDDIAALGIVLNQLFEKTESSSSQAHALTEASAREMKQALAGIQQAIDRLRPNVTRNREATLTLDDLAAEVARLQRVVEGVLFLARTGSGTLVVDMKPVPLAPLIDELVHDAAHLAAEQSVQVKIARSDGGVQVVDESLLRQLFLHLFSNALAASPREGTITIDCFAGNGRWQLVVTDEGPGLPVDQHYRVFEPFARYTPPDSPAAPAGAGLGLTLCERIAQLHGGTIRARNHASGRGLRVTLAVPIQTDDAKALG